MSWTNPRTWVLGELVSETLLNTHLRDNLNFLKSNPVLAEVSGTAQVFSGVNGSVVALSTGAIAIPSDVGAVYCEAWGAQLQTNQHQNATANGASVVIVDSVVGATDATFNIGIGAASPIVWGGFYIRSTDFAWGGETHLQQLSISGGNCEAVLTGPYRLRLMRSY